MAPFKLGLSFCSRVNVWLGEKLFLSLSPPLYIRRLKSSFQPLKRDIFLIPNYCHLRNIHVLPYRHISYQVWSRKIFLGALPVSLLSDASKQEKVFVFDLLSGLLPCFMLEQINSFKLISGLSNFYCRCSSELSLLSPFSAKTPVGQFKAGSNQFMRAIYSISQPMA